MLYRKVPKTGDELSILGFGCMRLPQKDGRIDEDRATGQIRYAIDHGVNYVDTAWPYHGGESEPFVGRALAGGYRERVKLATKLPAWLVRSRADMDRFLDAQLEKLRHVADRLLPGPLAEWNYLGAGGGARRSGVSRPGAGRRTNCQRRLFLSRDAGGFQAHRGCVSVGVLPDSI